MIYYISYYYTRSFFRHYSAIAWYCEVLLISHFDFAISKFLHITSPLRTSTLCFATSSRLPKRVDVIPEIWRGTLCQLYSKSPSCKALTIDPAEIINDKMELCQVRRWSAVLPKTWLCNLCNLCHLCHLCPCMIVVN